MYDVVDNGRGLTNGRTPITARTTARLTDARDVDGNLWVGWGMGHEELDGVAVFNPEGKPIWRTTFLSALQCCFGGDPRIVCSWGHFGVLVVRNTQGAV